MRDGISTLLAAMDERQHNRILRLSFPNGDQPQSTLLVNVLEASEGLSRPFAYTVELLSDDAHIPLKQLQGKLLCVELVRKDGTMRHFTGRVFQFGLKKVDGGLAYYEARLGPWLDYLSLRKDNYLFHNTTLYDQAASIFRDYGSVADWDWRVKQPGRPMKDACQFDETDLNYLARRWSAAGLFYWFEHSASGHRLVVSDDSTVAAPIDGDPDVPYQRHAGATEEDGFGEWSPVRELVHGSVSLSSYDFKSGRPVVTSTSTLNQQGEVPNIESYEYLGAFGFKDLAGADALAKLRMEEIEARGKRFEGAGNNRHLMPGRWFRLTDHFDGEDDNEFLVVECRHRATNNYQVGEGGLPHYENQVSCIRKKIPWRPGRGFHCSETRIYGIQTATVVGPRGEEIHTDEFGRVRVQFHWDREGTGDERSSTWIRVATAWAGSNFGMTSIPRIGTEVIVSYMGGDPDRPIITGMIPNANTMPAWQLPANKTQSGIMSRSSPGGGVNNANAIRFEDRSGGEQMFVQAERNLDTVVKNDETRSVGSNRTLQVGGDNALQVGGNHTQGVGKDVTHTVGGAYTETIRRDMTVNVTEGRQDSTIKGDVTVTSSNGEITVTSPHKITLSVGGSTITMTPDEITIVAGKIFLNP
ncbi:MAG: type VI secretion system tip protein TssI/VgrG [Pseudomonadota bacterium]